MDAVENAQLFWKIVQATLEEIYALSQVAAEAQVLRLRGAMTPRAISRDIIYHSQPLHVAADIMGGREPISEQQVVSYLAIVERFIPRLHEPGVSGPRKRVIIMPDSKQFSHHVSR